MPEVTAEIWTEGNEWIHIRYGATHIRGKLRKALIGKKARIETALASKDVQLLWDKEIDVEVIKRGTLEEFEAATGILSGERPIPEVARVPPAVEEVKPPIPEVKPPGELECMICHNKFDHLIIGTCESCYKKWTGGK